MWGGHIRRWEVHTRRGGGHTRRGGGRPPRRHYHRHCRRPWRRPALAAPADDGGARPGHRRVPSPRRQRRAGRPPPPPPLPAGRHLPTATPPARWRPRRTEGGGEVGRERARHLPVRNGATSRGGRSRAPGALSDFTSRSCRMPKRCPVPGRSALMVWESSSPARLERSPGWRRVPPPPRTSSPVRHN